MNGNSDLFLYFLLSGSSKWAVAVTQPAPAFKATAVHNGEFKDLSLADFKGKYLVLFFYPLDLWVLLVILSSHSFSEKMARISWLH